MKMLVFAVLLATQTAFLCGCEGGGSAGSFTKAELCDQSAEAAHYIAAMSTSSDDVVRVTNQVIADRKYPVLGDKVTASIGAVVALSRGQKTPDEISASIKASCEK